MSIKRKIHAFLFAEGRSSIFAPFRRAYIRLASIKNAIKSVEPFLPKKMGELNPDKTIYLIKLQPTKAGLMYLYIQNLARCIVAERRGHVPVIEMAGSTLFEDAEPVFGTRDPWEYYFEQPAGISASEARQSRHVIMSRLAGWPTWHVGAWLDTLEFFTGADRRLDEFVRAAAKYARLNERTRERIERDWAELTSRGSGKIVAVMSRGTDYNRLKPAGHAIQPSPERLVAEARSMIERGAASRVFLHTEERAVCDIFERDLGDALLTFDRTYHDDYNDAALEDDSSDSTRNWIVAYIDKTAAKSHYEMNYEYLRGVVCASMCSRLICGINGGATSAIIMNDGKYEEVRAICDGYY